MKNEIKSDKKACSANVKVSYKIKKDESDHLLKRSVRDILRLKFLIGILNLICKVKIYGLKNIQNESCIYVSNHSSHLDMVCIYKVLIKRFGHKKVKKLCCLAASELQKNIIMKKIFQSLGAILVDRNGNMVSPLKILNKYMLEMNYSAIIFPEGTRSRDGKIGCFMKGAALSAMKANVPLVPIGIKGSFEIWPPDKKRPVKKWKRQVVTVSVGKPVYSENKNASELTEIIQKKVEELVK